MRIVRWDVMSRIGDIYCVLKEDKRHTRTQHTHTHIYSTHSRTYPDTLHSPCACGYNIQCARELMKRISMAFLVQIHHQNVNTRRQRHNGNTPATIHTMKMNHIAVVSICRYNIATERRETASAFEAINFRFRDLTPVSSRCRVAVE